MDELLQIAHLSFKAELDKLASLAPRLFIGLIFFVVFLVIGHFLSKSLERLLKRKNPRASLNFFIQSIKWAVWFLGFTFSMKIAGFGDLSNGLLASGGILAIALGFAFREIGENLIAGVMLVINRPFKINDLIKSGEFEGIVKSIELRHTHVRTADGKDIFIPSSHIFKDPLVNYTLDGLRRPDFDISVDYSANIDSVIKTCLDVIHQHEGVLKSPDAGIVIKQFDSAFVTLNIFFWINTFDKNTDFLKIKSSLQSNIKEALMNNKVTLSNDAVSNLKVFLEKQ